MFDFIVVSCFNFLVYIFKLQVLNVETSFTKSRSLNGLKKCFGHCIGEF